MTTLTLQTALWCFLGFVVGAVIAYLVARLLAPSGREAREAVEQSPVATGEGERR